MESIFGDTPIVLVVFEIVLVPVFLWVGHRLGKIIKSVDRCSNTFDAVSEKLDRLNGSLAKVIDEQNDAEVRAERLEGRLRGLDNKIEHLLRK